MHRASLSLIILQIATLMLSADVVNNLMRSDVIIFSESEPDFRMLIINVVERYWYRQEDSVIIERVISLQVRENLYESEDLRKVQRLFQAVYIQT